MPLFTTVCAIDTRLLSYKSHTNLCHQHEQQCLMQAVDVSATNKSHVSTLRFDDSDCYSLCCIVIHASKSPTANGSYLMMSHL